MSGSEKETTSQPATLEYSYECALSLDSCEPESLPIPSADDGISHEKILISGSFEDMPFEKVGFTTKNQGKFEDDTYFSQDGDVKRVQFNKIQVPVKIDPKATPGVRYFTLTQSETNGDGSKISCTVSNVDLSFRLT